MPRQAKILVVDDEPDIREVIQKILQDRGYLVTTASNGAEALARLGESSFDLILSDVKMPVMDGMELLQKVSLLYPDIPTVILSAFANIQDAVAAIKLGAYDYIAKPVYPDDLLLSIERALKYHELRRATRELEWTLRGAEALGLQVLELAPEAEEFKLLASLRQEAEKIQDFHKIAQIFLEGAQKLTLASRGSIFLFEPEQLELVCVARSGNNLEVPLETAVKMGEGVMSYVLQSGRPLLVADVSLEPRFYKHQRSKQYQTKSFIVVPIIGEKQWGLINLTDRIDFKPFTPRELFLGWLIARILAEIFQQKEWEEKHLGIQQALAATSAELEEFKECYHHLATSMPLGLALLDQNFTVTFINQAFAAYCQRQVHQIGLNILSYFDGLPEAERRKLEGCLLEVKNGARTVNCGEISLTHPKVGNRLFRIQLLHLPGSGVTPAIMMVLEDQTEKSQLQQRLDLYEHMAIMGNLYTCVVHELNNPLDGVRRYVSLARQKKDDAAAVDRFLCEAQKGLQKMALAIDSILNMANPTRVLKAQDSLANQLREAVKILLLQAKEQRVEVQFNTPPLFDQIIFGADLYTVFINLIKNALQAMPQGGSLTIEGFNLGDQVEIHFADTGVGIPAKDLPNIFKPFFSTKEQGQGLGLGLAICKKIIDRYCGQIEVDSTPGEGTKFIIRLPTPKKKGQESPGQ